MSPKLENWWTVELKLELRSVEHQNLCHVTFISFLLPVRDLLLNIRLRCFHSCNKHVCLLHVFKLSVDTLLIVPSPTVSETGKLHTVHFFAFTSSH